MTYGTEQTLSQQRLNAAEEDYRFKLAMLDAIKNGSEKAVIGVVKDRRPFTMMQVRSVAYSQSLMGSSAASCAAQGDKAGAL